MVLSMTKKSFSIKFWNIVYQNESECIKSQKDIFNQILKTKRKNKKQKKQKKYNTNKKPN